MFVLIFTSLLFGDIHVLYLVTVEYCPSPFGFLWQNTLDWWLLHNRNLFLTFMEVVDSVSGEGLVIDVCLFAMPSHGRRGKGSLGGHFKGHSFHSWGYHPKDLITSQMYYLLTPSHWMLTFNILILGGPQVLSIASTYSVFRILFIFGFFIEF